MGRLEEVNRITGDFVLSAPYCTLSDSIALLLFHSGQSHGHRGVVKVQISIIILHGVFVVIINVKFYSAELFFGVEIDVASPSRSILLPLSEQENPLWIRICLFRHIRIGRNCRQPGKRSLTTTTPIPTEIPRSSATFRPLCGIQNISCRLFEYITHIILHTPFVFPCQGKISACTAQFRWCNCAVRVFIRRYINSQAVAQRIRTHPRPNTSAGIATPSEQSDSCDNQAVRPFSFFPAPATDRCARLPGSPQAAGGKKECRIRICQAFAPVRKGRT